MHTFIERLSFRQALEAANSEGKFESDLFELWVEVRRKEGSFAPEENLGHKTIKILSKDMLTFDGKTFYFKEEEIANPEPVFGFDEFSRSLVVAPPVYNADHRKVILFIY